MFPLLANMTPRSIEVIAAGSTRGGDEFNKLLDCTDLLTNTGG